MDINKSLILLIQYISGISAKIHHPKSAVDGCYSRVQYRLRILKYSNPLFILLDDGILTVILQ